MPTPHHQIVIATSSSGAVLQHLCHEQFAKVSGVAWFGPIDDALIDHLQQQAISSHRFSSFASLHAWFRTLQADLLIVYKVPRLLPPFIYQSFPLGAINIHPSLLPLHRGSNPWFWVYYNMEMYTGVTIHRIDPIADHGDLLLQRRIPIEIGTPLNQLRAMAEERIVEMLTDLLSNWTSINPTPQETFATPSADPHKIDLHQLIDLKRMEVIRVWHLLRGFPQLLPALCQEVKPTDEYSIGNLHHNCTSQANSAIGTLLHTPHRHYLICLDGLIEIVSL